MWKRFGRIYSDIVKHPNRQTQNVGVTFFMSNSVPLVNDVVSPRHQGESKHVEELTLTDDRSTRELTQKLAFVKITKRC